jgi:hypothetical protein
MHAHTSLCSDGVAQGKKQGKILVPKGILDRSKIEQNLVSISTEIVQKLYIHKQYCIFVRYFLFLYSYKKFIATEEPRSITCH